MLLPKDKDWLNGYKNKTRIYAVYKKPTSDLKTHRLKVRGWKNIFHANGKQKKAGVAILISDKIDLKVKNITRDKEKLKRIKYHQTTFTTNGKGTYIIKKYKRRKKSTKSTPNN